MSVATNFTGNGLNQYTAVSGHAAPLYDTKFNLSGYDGWSYIYDADKRLISAGSAAGGGHSAQFVYDGLGRCVKRTIDGVSTVYTYDEWKTVVEWSDAGAFVAWNLYGPSADEILVRYQPNTGGYLHYHLDAMGNVQFLLSGELNLGLEKYTYDAFGQPRITGWNGDVRTISRYGNRFMFTGREYLYTLGIYDYRHRLYHPGLGRFIQTDPIGFDGDPMNLYRYCGGNPILHNDPTGLFDWTWRNLMLWQGSAGATVTEIMNPDRYQAGMITYASVAEKAEGPKPSNSTASMRFVPKLEKDGKTAVPSDGDHSGSYYPYQFTDSAGRPRGGAGYTVKEKLTLKPNVPHNVEVKKKDEKPIALQASGIYRDYVGLWFRPTSASNGLTSVVYQTFDVKYNGHPVAISTRLVHDVRVIDGEVVRKVWVDRP
jgi:RHS repeat-associated protein